MKRWLGYLLLGLAAYVLFLVVRLPANVVWSYAEPSIKQQVPKLQVAGVSGRLWRGEAAMVGYNGQSVGRLGWRVVPWSLFGGKVAVPLSLQLPQGYLQADLKVPFDLAVLQAVGVKGQLPIGQLQTLFSYYPVTLNGTLALDIEQLKLDAEGNVQALHGQVNWVGAEVVAPQAMKFGDLQAALEMNDKGVVSARLTDRGGSLRLDATIVLQPQGSYTLAGTVAAGEGAEPGLIQALGWLGKPDREGRYRLNWKGRL